MGEAQESGPLVLVSVRNDPLSILKDRTSGKDDCRTREAPAGSRICRQQRFPRATTDFEGRTAAEAVNSHHILSVDPDLCQPEPTVRECNPFIADPEGHRTTPQRTELPGKPVIVSVGLHHSTAAQSKDYVRSNRVNRHERSAMIKEAPILLGALKCRKTEAFYNLEVAVKKGVTLPRASRILLDEGDVQAISEDKKPGILQRIRLPNEPVWFGDYIMPHELKVVIELSDRQ